jgi:hypothetical protein
MSNLITKEEVAAFDGLEESYRKAEVELNKIAPLCHMKKMFYSQDDAYPIPNHFWECSICGHTKDFK